MKWASASRSGRFARAVSGALALGGAALLTGCSTTSLVLGAAGIATDTSVTWDVVKHVHAKLTEGDATPCVRLDSVQRALNPRCGALVAGSVRAADLQRAQLQRCALGVAAADPRLWPALPEFIAQGARPEACEVSPLVELAQRGGCPDFGAASPAVLASIRRLAETDARAVHFDVVRALSCPSAVAAGLDDVLVQWHAAGKLDLGRIAFGPLGALHPDHLGTPLARALEARGHTALQGLGGHDGRQPPSFELALRGSRWDALEWWLARVPSLANRVPAAHGDQLPWVPLAKVLTPNFIADPAGRAAMVGFLLARGANPWQKLPHDAGSSVVHYARTLRSPELALLDPPLASAPLVLAAVPVRGAGE
jgi:hypothetical protein